MEKNISSSLTVFANFFIDNEERLQRMKDSYRSFEKIQPREWIINIRGKLKLETGEFLKKEIGDKVKIFYLNSTFGWSYDSKKIFINISGEYVLNWIEDHILLAPPKILLNCIKEMDKYNVDQLWYSWFLPTVLSPFDQIEKMNQGSYITCRKIGNLECAKLREFRKKNGNFNDFCIVSAQSIMKKSFFQKVLYSNKPYFKRYPRKTPYDFEKRSKDNVSKEIVHAIPNKELFVSIDDDLHNPGYSLISRGLYENRMSRIELKISENPPLPLRKKIKKIIPKFLLPFILKLIGYSYRTLYTINVIWNK